MRIATYNVFNLHVGDKLAAVKSTRAMSSLVWAINSVDADIMVLQEVADDGSLSRINEALASPYEVARVMPGNDIRGFHQALLSRYECHSTSVEEFMPAPSDSSEATGEAGGYQRNLTLHQFPFSNNGNRVNLAIVSLHLKSGYVHPDRPLPDSDTVRFEEATQIVRWINHWYQTQSPSADKTALLIAGDLNETYDRPAVQLLCTELGLVDLVQRDWIQQDQRPSYSWFTRNTKARLDYLLVDSDCASLVEPGTIRIHVAAAMRKASDHYPVSVDLMLQ